MEDITDTLVPKSNQLDNIDLATGPRIFTVESVDVHKGSEQPVVIHLAEFDRPWKPGVTMRRVLAACWGTKSSEWVGKRAELYRDPNVTYGKDKPGGTRVRALTGITAPVEVDVMLSQGRMGKYRVEPLTDDAPKPNARQRIPASPIADVIADETDVAELRRMWATADAETKTAIENRVADLQAAAAAQPELVPDDAA